VATWKHQGITGYRNK